MFGRSGTNLPPVRIRQRRKRITLAHGCVFSLPRAAARDMLTGCNQAGPHTWSQRSWPRSRCTGGTASGRSYGVRMSLLYQCGAPWSSAGR